MHRKAPTTSPEKHFYDELFGGKPRHKRERKLSPGRRLAAGAVLGALALTTAFAATNLRLDQEIAASNADTKVTRMVEYTQGAPDSAQPSQTATKPKYDLCIDIFHGFNSNNGEYMARKVAKHVDRTKVSLRYAVYGNDFSVKRLSKAIDDTDDNCTEMAFVDASLGATLQNEAAVLVPNLPPVRFILEISGPRTINQVKNAGVIGYIASNNVYVPPALQLANKAARCASQVPSDVAWPCTVDAWQDVSQQSTKQQQQAQLHEFASVITDRSYRQRRQILAPGAQIVMPLPESDALDPIIYASAAVADWKDYYGDAASIYTPVVEGLTHASTGTAIDDPAIASWLRVRSSQSLSSPTNQTTNPAQYIPHAA